MANNRIYYPLQYIAFGGDGAISGIPAHGVQTLSTETAFDTEQVFELGQLEIYENIEALPSVEISVSKVLDGYPLLYHLATQDASSASLASRLNEKSVAFINYFSDSQENSSGTPISMSVASGLYVDSLEYSIPVEGNVTETISLVGNDKEWVGTGSDSWYGNTGFAFDGHFTGGDSPAFVSGVLRRENVKMGSAAAGGSVWPTVIPGLTVVNGSGYNVESGGEYGAHIQDVSISVSANREDLLELGRRAPYFRYPNFPVAVETSIEVNVAGDDPGDFVEAKSNQDNISDEPIFIKLEDSTTFYLGTKNFLTSVRYGGGDTDGGIATATYSFQNFNILEVKQDNDPAGL